MTVPDPALDPAEEFEELTDRLQEWVYALQMKPPTVAEAAAALDTPPLRIAEVVGRHYWMFLTGDFLSPETTRIEVDGE